MDVQKKRVFISAVSGEIFIWCQHQVTFIDSLWTAKFVFHNHFVQHINQLHDSASENIEGGTCPRQGVERVLVFFYRGRGVRPTPPSQTKGGGRTPPGSFFPGAIS